MKETAIWFCSVTGVVTFALYLALFILVVLGALRETKNLKFVIGVLFSLNGLGVVLAAIFSGEFHGHSSLTNFVILAGAALFIGGCYVINIALFQTGEQKKRAIGKKS